MTQLQDEKKTRTPRNLEAILKGALALEFSDRVELCKQLRISIDVELEATRKAAEEKAKAAAVLGGTQER